MDSTTQKTASLKSSFLFAKVSITFSSAVPLIYCMFHCRSQTVLQRNLISSSFDTTVVPVLLGLAYIQGE
jgi:hypothetical protein